MRLLLTLMTLTLLGSCQNEIIAKFEIKNMTNETIDSISIKSFDHQRNSEFIQLKSGESKSYWLDMTKLPKVDGEYLLTFRRNMTNKELKRFGYFTNGYPLEEVTNIQFKKDTILIKQVSNSY